MTEDVFRKKLASILEADEANLSGEFRLDYGNWDSLTVMATIAAIDEQYDLSVTPKELAACSNVQSLMAFIRTKTSEP